MEKETHCYRCRYYAPYFLKGYCRFERQDLGFCAKEQTTVGKHFGCEKFEGAVPNRHTRALSKKIDDTIELFRELKAVLELELEEEQKFEEEQREDFQTRRTIRETMKSCPYARNGECPAQS